ncbi:hypothetical protein FW774_06365 [Pedobacter sp. BS3]|uniref:hypothetical protein n=1 Tax=Pedobacter sp. BS3 TaxID=2567937 RepID=UPI0011EDCB2E|nr:hypothetical protein [Pedobacter sp. BS3]TZF84606.1 hypothetical protein FW774_06365 [Pedobacter sp. BS3]
MNTSKVWYTTVLQINTELENRTKSDNKHPLDLLLMEQANTLIQLFNECEFVGFPKTDPEAETIISNILAKVQNSLSDKMDFVPENPFFNLYLGLCYLEKVLQLIKQEYESNLNTTLEHLENIIYNSNDYQNLVEVSRNIGRRIINKQQHPEFGKLKQHITEQLEYIERSNKIEKALPPQPIKTKADILKEQLSQYGFFELEKVKTLSEQSKVSIIEKIAESGLPYAIAMFDYLQFIPYLEKKHFDSKYKLNREVSKWFDSDKEGRAVKGNISSLLKNTTENKDRYTAYKHKENVIKDYELLK